MAAENRKAPRLNDAKSTQGDARAVLDTAKIYSGEMVQQDASGEVAPATDVASVDVLGVSQVEIDNTDDGKEIEFISMSIHGMDNAGDITKVDIGSTCYVLDAATVSLSANVNSNKAGKIVEVDINSDSLVYVDFDPAKK